jgi:AP endonuclease-1
VTSSAVPESSPQSQGRTKTRKLDIDEVQDQGSPLRRSKRVKSETLKASPVPDQSEIIDGPSAADLRQKKAGVSPRKRKSQSRVSVKEEVKEEVEEEIEITVNTKVDKGSQADPEKADGITTVTGKVSRKRKTKKEKELEMVPLRARTQGVRMCVGAHVSAAKGWFLVCFSMRLSCVLPGRS